MTTGGRFSRGVAATWWYTASAVIAFELLLVLVWTGALLEIGVAPAGVLTIGLGGIVWAAGTVPLLLVYRRRIGGTTVTSPASLAIALAVAVAYGVLAGLLSGSWVIGVLPVVQVVVLMNWPPGVRLRIVIAVSVLLAALWFVDTTALPSQRESGWWLLGFYSVLLPSMTVLSLWWWDVLVTIDRARLSEARLGATQERLRVATDVHDLQGHHLQVIALQLELAERLMASDPAAALEQLQAARTSVDEARQGTRDLATRFRTVPLRDEIDNAVDLLRAAGITAEAVVDADADRAPASVLAPVIRETTTNVLRHGGGDWARLTLTHAGDEWRYEISNDGSDVQTDAGGSGLIGIENRVGEAGGSMRVRRERGEFALEVLLPVADAT
ncbi:MAG: histidine kinase [Microbacterium sp.]